MATLMEMQKLMQRAIDDQAFATALQNDPVKAAASMNINMPPFQAEEFTKANGLISGVLGGVHSQLNAAKAAWVNGASVIAFGCPRPYAPKSGSGATIPSLQIIPKWDAGNDVARAVEIALRGGGPMYVSVKQVLNAVEGELSKETDSKTPGTEPYKQVERLREMQKLL